MVTPRDPLFGDAYGSPADRTDSLPPYSPEAERGVLGCCLLDPAKLAEARKAGVTSRWFYEVRHAELFELLGTLPPTDAGDPVLVTIAMRAKEKLESIGGLAYLAELGDSVPSAANLPYYLDALRGYFQRRLVIDALTRLRCIVEDTGNSPAGVVSDTEALLEICPAPRPGPTPCPQSCPHRTCSRPSCPSRRSWSKAFCTRAANSSWGDLRRVTRPGP